MSFMLVAPTRCAVIDKLAEARRERLEHAACARQPLAMGLFRHFAHRGRIGVRDIEHVGQQVRQAVLTIEAGQHRQRAAELDLFDHQRIAGDM
jgi:hypothetical protein